MAQLGVIGRGKRLLARNLWIRPAIASLFSITMAAGAYLFGRSYDGRFDLGVDEGLLVSLFTIFASSMLSVATFTVSAIVTAASGASNSTTPRASRLVPGDSKAQIVLWPMRTRRGCARRRWRLRRLAEARNAAERDHTAAAGVNF